MNLTEAIDALLVYVPEDQLIPYRSELRKQFEVLDAAVWVEACKLGLESKLPPEPGLGFTHLPGRTHVNGDFSASSSKRWRNHLLALRLIVKDQDLPLADKPEDIKEPELPRLTVNLERMEVSLNGKTFNVDSTQALRWLKVLANNPGAWISSTEMKDYDAELDGDPFRPDKLKKFFPSEIRNVLQTNRKKGTRISLPH